MCFSPTWFTCYETSDGLDVILRPGAVWIPGPITALDATVNQRETGQLHIQTAAHVDRKAFPERL